MKTRRRAAALAGVAVLGAVALTGCDIDKPTPIVTVVSGSDSVHSEAECYSSKEVASAELEKCLQDSAFTKISATVGGSYRIGVDKKIADNGWTLLVDGEPIGATFNSTYGPEFPVPYAKDTDASGAPVAPPAKSITVHVVERANNVDAPVKGIWAFKVEKKKP